MDRGGVIYMDYNATTPVDKSVLEAMTEYFSVKFGNPSSGHFYGFEAKKAIEEARYKVSRLLGCEMDEVIFTSGGTESNNMVLFGLVQSLGLKKGHIITSRIEHPSVLEPIMELLNGGFDVTFLPVDSFGVVDPGDVLKAVRRDTFLISIMHANNEIGTIEPIEEIGKIARERGIYFHSDGAQSIGKIPVKVQELNVDFLTLAGHKLYAPKGIGALYCRKNTPPAKVLFGAGQEKGLRPGTENVPYIVGLGRAAELASESLSSEDPVRILKLRNLLKEKILEKVKNVVVNGHPSFHLPNTLSVSFYKKNGDALLKSLENVAASTGAACHAGKMKVSHVLEALGADPDYAPGTIRFSIGRFTTEDEVLEVAQSLGSLLAED